jgi:glycolate dehydrogenase FAD-binding subunit
MLERLFPSSEIIEVGQAADVADIVSAACGQRRPVYPIGGGTSLGLGAVADESGAVLSLAKLNRLIDYPSRDLTITVEAGMTVAELAGHLAAENQRLPLDIALDETATVGGVVAANLSGPRRYRFGTMRDYLLGVNAVGGTGKAFSAGGRVVKNAAGYDLTRLMVGSMGTLGVITQVTLMVRPQPAMSAFAAIPLPSFEKADSLLESMGACHLEPTALELVVGDRLPEGADPEAAATLWIGFESSQVEVRWMLDVATEPCRKQGLDVALKDAPDLVESIWRELTDASVIQEDRRDTTLAVEVTVLPSKTVAVAKRLQEIDANVSLHCRAGNGVLLAQFPCEPEQTAQCVTDVRAVAVGLGGRAVVTAFPLESRLDRQTIWGPPGDEMRVMQRVKQQFDPQGILNCGRFVFERPQASVQT